jgi:hypothetical protein
VASWPKLPEIRTFLRMQPDATEDTVIDTARLAAIDYGQQILGVALYPVDTDALPDACHQACVQHSARLYRRRDSLDGTLGLGDSGVVRIGGRDPDIAALYGTYAPPVFG